MSDDERTAELDVLTTTAEPVYESVRCSRCGHEYPLVVRDTEIDRPTLCEECRGQLFAAEHSSVAQPHQ